jgi:hypothetical protein
MLLLPTLAFRAWRHVLDQLFPYRVKQRRRPYTRRTLRPLLETLEDRTAPAVFNVPSGNEPGTIIPNLGAAIVLADANSDASNIINLAPGSYPVVNQAIVAASSKTLMIVGQGSGVTITADGQGRVFTIDANVVLEGLTITGGKVEAASAQSLAQGGGLLIDGGQVTLSSVNVTANTVRGGDWPQGAAGTSNRAGDNGGHGGDAQGAGIYLASGSLTLHDSAVTANTAVGGKGGSAGNGAAGVPETASASAGQRAMAQGGNGGAGGHGGAAQGGGIYVAQGQLSIDQGSSIDENVAQGGVGGLGGNGGHGASEASRGGAGGNGGAGGTGGQAAGAGLYLASASMVLEASAIAKNTARGGVGGPAGHGQDGGQGGKWIGLFSTRHQVTDGFSSGTAGKCGKGGQGGHGGSAQGAGAYLGGGTLKAFSATIANNSAQGGAGGAAGLAGRGGDTGQQGIVHPSKVGGIGGDGGAAQGGGMYVASAVPAVTLVDTKFLGDIAGGGPGQAGATGVSGIKNGVGGDGGVGGAGGLAAGGALYLSGGAVTLFGGSISQESAIGGRGGSGGNGGPVGSGYRDYASPGHGNTGGSGGAGGPGGKGFGGGIYLGLACQMTLVNATVSATRTLGGNGGKGGNGAPGVGGSGYGGTTRFSVASLAFIGLGGAGGRGGQGGGGGNAEGGGIYVASVISLFDTIVLSLVNTTVDSADAWGGSGATGGSGANGGNGAENGGPASNGGAGGASFGGIGGDGEGGAIYISGNDASISGGAVSGTASGGDGGAAQDGGNGGDGGAFRNGGNGGWSVGGNGGSAEGGAVYVDSLHSLFTAGTSISGSLLPGPGGPAGQPGTPGAGGDFGSAGNAGMAVAGSVGVAKDRDVDGSSQPLSSGPATQLVISPIPASVNAATPFPDPVYVLAEDASGNIVPSFNDYVTMAMGNKPGSATPGSTGQLSSSNGTTAAAAINGAAIFSGLEVSTSSTGDMLQAMAAGLPAAHTNDFHAIGYTPDQVRAAYGLNSLGFNPNGTPASDGAGQTIAIIVPNHDPNIFVDVDEFDLNSRLQPAGQTLYQLYGSAGPRNGNPGFLTVLNQSGLPVSSNPISSDFVWTGNQETAEEEAMDVEWAHAIAPGAKIVVLEFNAQFVPARFANFLTAVKTVDKLATGGLLVPGLPPVSVVSMSLGFTEGLNLPPFAQISQSQEAQADAYFSTAGVTYVASTGDQGVADASYPAFSPNVLAVGGTTLRFSRQQGYIGENGWSGSGGGPSLYEAEPSYQAFVQSTGQRTIPDVAWDADGITGVNVVSTYQSILDSIFSSGSDVPVGTTLGAGTSLSAPCWAAFLAIVDQSRKGEGRPVLGSTQTLQALYSAPASDFHKADLTSSGGEANNGTSIYHLADPENYNEVTGLGTPKADLLIPYLTSYSGPLSFDPTFPAGTVGVPYSQTITASGGVGPKNLKYSINNGAVPAGLSFVSTISELDVAGTPTSVGTVTFAVTATDATGESATDTYTFTINPAGSPTVTSISPATGSVGGGTILTITGTNFFGATAVDFGSNPGTIISNSSTQITVTSPPGSLGSVPVTVTTPVGTSPKVAADKFTYVPPSAPPTIVVNTASDAASHSGTSLRDAVAQANSDAAKGVSDTIGFAASLASQMIALTQGQLEVTGGSGSVTIDGGGQITIGGDDDRIFLVDTGASLVLTGLTLSGGADPNGGAIYSHGALTVSKCTLTGNSADNANYVGGGAIFNYHGTLTVSDSTLSHNIADTTYGGGAIYNDGGTATVSNSTLAYNSTAASIAGGAIYNDLGTLTVSGSTLTDNSAGTTGGGGIYSTGTLTLVNTIVAGNNAPTDPDVELALSGTATGNNNLIGDNSGLTGIANGVAGNQVGSSSNPLDPMLGPFANNSGTTDTFGLLAASPAIGGGGALTTITQNAGTIGTSIEVTNAAAIASTPGQYFALIDGEEMEVTNVNLTTNILTVVRGLNGITASPQQGDPVSLYTDERGNPRSTPAAIGASEFTLAPSAAPVLTSITASVGPVAGGTTVTITGTDLAGATAVQFGLAAGTIVSDSNTQIMATSPASVAGTVDVTVTTAGGSSTPSAADQFSYIAAPAVASIVPGAGPAAGGTTVTITGAHLLGATAVDFGSNAGTIVRDNASRILVIAPAGATGSVDVTITTPDGTSALSAADTFTYEGTPTVTGVSPMVAGLARQTIVTITGTNLLGAEAVQCGTSPTTILSDTATQLVVAVGPGGSLGEVNLAVTTTCGTSAAVPFVFAQVPSVTGIGPATGQVTGGTSVTITGTNLLGVTSVNFGATAVTDFVNQTATQLVVMSPAGAAGTVDVTVATPAGTSTTSTADQFTYGAGAIPVVTGVSPAVGSLSGNTSVTITGTNFAGGTAPSVFFGTIQGTVTNFSLTQIVVRSPQGAAGAVDVTVATAAGTSRTTSADVFTYLAAPTVTDVSPDVGPEAGGTQVTITGANLRDTTIVYFNGAPATIVSDAATQLVVLSPAGVASTFDIEVDTPGGRFYSNATQFTYVAVPAISAVSPASGPETGGTQVTITGTDLSGATAISFGANSGTIISDSATQIVATSPAGVTGTVDITVTTVGGTSLATVADQFTYGTGAQPLISEISPNVGPIAGGIRVTITGANFAGTANPVVLFGGTAATIISVSLTQIVVTTPAGAAGNVNVTVAAAGETSAPAPFTYAAVPTVSELSPATGPADGGTQVTITGTKLADASAVLFGSATVTTFASDTPTQLVFASPPGAAGTVPVTVKTAGGTVSAGSFLYVAAPTITALSTAVGPSSGGTYLLITGTNLANAAVSFGAKPATILSDSNALIEVASPSGSAGAVNVTAVTAGGTSVTSAADQFTYLANPALTAVSPETGDPAGDTAVTITGSGLARALEVLFGTTVVTSFTSDTDEQIIVNSPPSAAGTVDVSVVTAGGTSLPVLGDQFTYGAGAAPVVDGVSPAAGPLAGGTMLTIGGSNFAGKLTVKVGAKQAAIVSSSTTQIVATTPAGAAGTVDVTVTAAGGTSRTGSADQFTYVLAPTVTSLAPASGLAAGGATVNITGTHLATTTAVDFGTNAGTIVSVSDTRITALSPPGAGTVDVTVVAGGGTSKTSAADRFTYLPAPAISSLSPASGSYFGGTTVTVTGSNLGAPATATVAFGGKPATIVSDNGTAIVAVSPAGALGVVDVTVTTSGGPSPTSSADRFTYIVPLVPAFTTAASAVFTMGTNNQALIATTSQYTAALTIGGVLPTGVTLHDNGDGTATLRGMPGATLGTYTFNVVANNNHVAPAIQVFTLTVVDPPTITSAGSTTFTVKQAGKFTITSAAGLPAPTTLTETGTLPTGIVFTAAKGSATLAGTPAAGTAGIYTFTITAGNGPVSASGQLFTLTVNQPVLSAPAGATFVEGQQDTVTFTTTGLTTPTLAATGSLPSNVTFHDNGNGTATLSGTPAAGTARAAPYSITIVATSNGKPPATETFQLAVDRAPAITSAASASFTVGTSGTFIIQTTAGVPAKTTLSVRGTLPAGVVFTANTNGTATLHGTPAGSGGTYSFTIVAQSAVAATATQTFTLVVFRPLTVTTASIATFNVGQPGGVIVTAKGFTTALSESGPLPAGVSFSDNGNGTATLSGTPRAGSGGVYRLTIGSSTGTTLKFTLTVLQAPVITTAPGTTFSVSQSNNSFTISTALGSYPTPAFSVNGLPPHGVKLIDNKNGTATLSGNSLAKGTYTFAIIASAAGMPAAEQLFVLTVS